MEKIVDGKDETEERRLNSTNAQSIGKEKLLSLLLDDCIIANELRQYWMIGR